MDIGDILATLLALVAIGVAAYFGYHEYIKGQRKKLGWDIETKVPLFLVHEKAAGKLEILYNGKAIEGAHLIQIKIKNLGGRDIVPSDFVEPTAPLKIKFNGTGRLLELLQLSTSSENLEIILLPPLSNTSELTIDKFFLQKGEWFSLGMIVGKYQGGIVSARIADCDVVSSYAVNMRSFWVRLAGLLAVVCIIPLAFYLLGEDRYAKSFVVAFFTAALVMWTIVSTGLVIYLAWNLRRFTSHR